MIASDFWKRVHVATAGECWLWALSLDAHGYGQSFASGKISKAHRLAWEFANGPIPEGMEVCHNCPGGDNPACVNPAHLWLGTHAQNMADMVAKGRHRPGRIIGTDQPGALLDDEKVRAIRRRVAAGESQTSVARDYKVDRSTVGLVVAKRTWQHVVDL